MSLATRLSAFAQAVGADIKAINSKLPYKGNWSGAATYNKGDIVWYSNDFWVAVQTISGAGEYPSPDYPTVWRLLSEGMSLGGTPGQFLTKGSANSFDTTWVDSPLKTATKTLDTWHQIGAAGEPAFQNGWSAYDSTVWYRKDIFGRVYLRGSLNGGANASIAFQLPVGYRPAASGTNRVRTVSIGNQTAVGQWEAQVNVDPVGNVYIYFTGSSATSYVSLDQVSFDATAIPELTVALTGASQATVPIDPWHLVGSAGEPAFGAGMTTPGGLPGLMFRKDPMGRVWIYGVVNGTSGNNAFILPAGYRPVTNPTYFDILQAGGVAGGYVSINSTNGAVTVTGPSGQYYIDVSFDTGLVTQMPTGPQGPKGDPGAAGGINVNKTLNWNTAVTPGVYRSTNDGLEQTLNSPGGDGINPPKTVGFVYVHESGALVQRVWDQDYQNGYTRYRGSDNTWGTWTADLTKPPVISGVMAGGAPTKDGDERYVQSALMKAQGVRWRQCYDATSALANKWEFVGGSGYRCKSTGQYTCVNPNAWEIVSAAGFPRFTIPLAGVYRIKFGSRFHQAVNTQVEGYFGIGVSTASSPIDSIRFNAGQNAAGVDIFYLAYELEQTFTEGQIIVAMHNTQNAVANVLYSGQWMEVTPLRTS